MPSILALLASLAVAYGAAALGSVATARGLRSWYPALRRPSWTPSGRVIGAVWTVLYALMAIAAWLVADRVGLLSIPLAIYAVQLLLNVAWSFAFFAAEDPGAGVVVILALDASVLATLVLFAPVVPQAGWLFAPYLAWVLFASYLNVRIWRLNAPRRIRAPPA